MRRAARTDANHAAVVGCLKACGCEVQSLAAVGDGVADLLVFHRSTKRLLLVEVKDGKKIPSKRKLTADQVEWHSRWPVSVIERVEEVPGLLSPRPTTESLMEAF